ncbi:CDP-glycerol glycerophosphotransferase family protein [Photobacterium kishitanii]|nr:CDP-glycerol glycerophosphotransferase family protein [Photobacterium kishitanii]
MKYLISKISKKRIKYIMSFFCAYICFLIKKNKQKNWIVGSGNGLYENNIEVFCDTVIAMNKDIIFYFISDSDKPTEKMKVLKKGSIKAYYYALSAEVLIFDCDNSDIAPGFINFCRGLKVNLNHGQEGLKKLSCDYYKNIKSDLTCAVSNFEKNIKIKECGANPETVEVIGLARYDKLSRKIENKGRDILYFPTWRPWFKDDYKCSDYLEYIESILKIINDNRLIKYLELTESKLYIKPHFKIRDAVLKSKSKNVIICKHSDNLTELIRNTRYLITDYSSICWDYIYQRKDVFFYQFDFERYNNEVGLYLDKSESLFKKRFSDVDELILLLGENTDIRYKDELINTYFCFQDKNNSLRIFNEIIRKLN